MAMLNLGEKLSRVDLFKRFESIYEMADSGGPIGASAMSNIFYVVARDYPDYMETLYSDMERRVLEFLEAYLQNYDAVAVNRFTKVMLWANSSTGEAWARNNFIARMKQHQLFIRNNFPSQEWAKQLLNNTAFSTVFCVGCTQSGVQSPSIRKYKVGRESVAKGLWFNDQEQTVQAFLQHRYGSGHASYASVASFCGRGACPVVCGCGEIMSSTFNADAVMAFMLNKCCLGCIRKSLVYVERPKADRRELRDYAVRFRKIGRKE